MVADSSAVSVVSAVGSLGVSSSLRASLLFSTSLISLARDSASFFLA